MQLMLISGIVFAIGAVIFALQNNGLVVVTLALWSFEGSLAIVLLLTLGLGVLITGLLTTPAVIRAQWTNKRLHRRIAELERDAAERHAHEPRVAAPDEMQTPVAADPEKPYVGLRTLLTGDDPTKPAA